jgi:altronate dehydratase large subunit
MRVVETFLGYERPDGLAGIRNHVAIIPSVACANGVVAAISQAVPGVVPLYHGHGCGRAVEAMMHARVLTHLGKHPNVAAVLVVGLGCEVIKGADLAAAIGVSGKPVEYFNIQDVGGTKKSTEKGVGIVRKMISDSARMDRRPMPLDRIILGLQCGGSDAFSGITANPSVGLVSDWTVDQGGTVILTEDTEMIGTSHILERRACCPEVAKQTAKMIADAEALTHELMGPLAAYVISPGNMDGGMTSIREKALGCIVKAGSRPICEVVGYGETPTKKGVVLMDGPGYDLESMTGVAAAGSQVMIFTTGRGNPIGYPIVPVIKVASTSRMYQRMEDDMDVNAGIILDGVPMQAVAEQLIAFMRNVLDGKRTKAELNGQGGIVCLYTTHPSM